VLRFSIRTYAQFGFISSPRQNFSLPLEKIFFLTLSQALSFAGVWHILAANRLFERKT